MKLRKLYEAVKVMRNTAVVDDDFPKAMYAVDRLVYQIENSPAIPKVICLCGSSRFFGEYQKAEYELTMSGHIYLSIGFYPHSPTHGEGIGHNSQEKIMLDELHKRKIDMSDEVFVLNVGGYIGESTQSEIEYAEKHGIPVKYLEPLRGE